MRSSLRFLASSLCFIAPQAFADCTDPAGQEAQIIYNEDYKTAQLCNGTDWLAWGSGTDGSGWDRNGTSTYYNVGNVGIGTTTPRSIFDISGTTSALIMSPTGGLELIRNSSTTASGIGGYIDLKKDVNDDFRVRLSYKDNLGSGSDKGFVIETDSDGGAYSPDINMVVLDNGNVGIGTTEPSAQFHIKGADSNSRVRVERTGNATWEFAPAPAGKLYIVDDTLGTDLIRMAVDSSGNVGIGTTAPSYKLHVEGTAYATGAAGSLSDRRHKKEIVGLPDTGLATVAALRPVSFLWKEPQDKPMEGKQLGFIAQEVEEVLPEAVLTQDNDEHTKGLKYNVFMPVMVKAMQELKAENDALKAFVCEEKPKHVFCQ